MAKGVRNPKAEEDGIQRCPKKQKTKKNPEQLWCWTCLLVVSQRYTRTITRKLTTAQAKFNNFNTYENCFSLLFVYFAVFLLMEWVLVVVSANLFVSCLWLWKSIKYNFQANQYQISDHTCCFFFLLVFVLREYRKPKRKKKLKIIQALWTRNIQFCLFPSFRLPRNDRTL